MLRFKVNRLWLTWVLFAFCVPSALLAQEDELGDVESEAEAAQREEALALPRQIVTGSHLIGGDPSAKVFVLSAEDIQRRGRSSVEDIFRTLPWAFNSINTQTNMWVWAPTRKMWTRTWAPGVRPR